MVGASRSSEVSVSDFRSKLLEVAREMTDEEFEKVVGRLNGLRAAITGVIESVAVLLPPEVREALSQHQVSEDDDLSLCFDCANPCNSRSAEVLTCPKFSKFDPEKCLKCSFWDVNSCVNDAACIDGSYFTEGVIV